MIVAPAQLVTGRRVADSVVGESEAEQARHQRARFVGCDDVLDHDIHALQHRRQDVVTPDPRNVEDEVRVDADCPELTAGVVTQLARRVDHAAPGKPRRRKDDVDLLFEVHPLGDPAGARRIDVPVNTILVVRGDERGDDFDVRARRRALLEPRTELPR